MTNNKNTSFAEFFTTPTSSNCSKSVSCAATITYIDEVASQPASLSNHQGVGGMNDGKQQLPAVQTYWKSFHVTAWDQMIYNMDVMWYNLCNQRNYIDCYSANPAPGQRDLPCPCYRPNGPKKTWVSDTKNVNIDIPWSVAPVSNNFPQTGTAVGPAPKAPTQNMSNSSEGNPDCPCTPKAPDGRTWLNCQYKPKNECAQTSQTTDTKKGTYSSSVTGWKTYSPPGWVNGPDSSLVPAINGVINTTCSIPQNGVASYFYKADSQWTETKTTYAGTHTDTLSCDGYLN